MYQQRAHSTELRLPHRPRPWRPHAEREDGTSFTVDPEPADRYVVVDDVAYGGVVFDIVGWPRLDEAGRLVFGHDRDTRVEPLDRAQAAADGGRAAAGQVLRPLRVGDAFHVRRTDGPIDEWVFLADVTRAARDAARLALFGAVAPRLDPAEAERLPPVEDEPERPAERGVTGPGAARPAL